MADNVFRPKILKEKFAYRKLISLSGQFKSSCEAQSFCLCLKLPSALHLPQNNPLWGWHASDRGEVSVEGLDGWESRNL